jgi:S1-C subfamily serine protease
MNNMIKSRKFTVAGILALGLLAGVLAWSMFNSATPKANPVSTQTATEVFISDLMPMPVMGLVVDRDLRVMDIEIGSGAEKAGIQKGDVIHSISGTLPKSAMDAKAMMGRFVREKQVTLDLERKGTRMQLVVELSYPASKRGQPTATPVPADQTYF